MDMVIVKKIKSESEDKMKKTIIKLGEELSSIRTGRANASMLEPIRVEAYGTQMPINQLANVVIPEARTIEIIPWDITTLEAITKAISKSQLGINPSNDGKLVRIVLPALTEDSRKNFVKYAKQIEEQFKITIRNERRDANTALKTAEKNKEITEDMLRGAEDDIQKMTDIYIKKIDDMVRNKEAEIMEV